MIKYERIVYIEGKPFGERKKSIHSECHGIGYGEKKRKNKRLEQNA